MMSPVIAAIQMCSTQDVDDNLLQAKKYIQQAVEKGAKCVVLPENFAFMGFNPKDKLLHKEVYGEGKIQSFLSEAARQYGIWVIGGTLPLEVPHDPNKIYAACLMYNDTGVCVGRYDKIHLFDIELHAHQELHYESETIFPGNTPVVINTPWGKCGLAVCYDIRFPELFRAMQAKGAEIIVLPAAFTVPTGLAHWEVLIRARAIENQVYMVAAAEVGSHPNHRKTYGHSMIVNPWGEVIASLSTSPGVVSATLDMELLQKLRLELPVLKHKKI